MSFIKDRSVIITGASRGIGKALALHLAKEGMNVASVARSKNDLESLKKAIDKLGVNCLIFSGNVANEAFAKQVVKSTHEAFGSIDFLVNNAGFGIFGPTKFIDEKDWSELMDTNVKGTFLFTKAAIPYLEEQGYGHLISITSDVAKRVFSEGSLYCASKFAQEAFTASIRKELRPKGIKVSSVYSGVVDTYFHNKEQGNHKQKAYLKVDDMAQSITFIMNQGPNVVIDELMIHPLSQDY